MTAPDIDTIEETAHSWRVRLAADDATEAERRAFRTWLAGDLRHRQAYEDARAMWDAMGHVDRAALPPAFFEPGRHERTATTVQGTLQVLRRPVAGIAAAAIAAACLAVFIALPIRQPAPPQLSDVAKAVTPRVHKTAIGEIRTEPLADGSTVTLGAGSAVAILFTPGERTVRLDSGEAFFQVVPDPDRPFRVTAGDAHIRVIGTAFDVQRKAGLVRVGVAEGVVTVTHPMAFDHKGKKRGGGIRSRRQLTAGQRLSIAPETGIGKVAPVRVETVALWRARKLAYNGATLAEVVADANRHYDRTITIADPALGGLKVTATFNADDIDRMLTTLADALSITVDRSGDGDIRLTGRP